MIAPPFKKVIVSGIAMKIYGIGWLALLTHRKPATIRMWQRRSILPPPVLKTDDGVRWYTAAELAGYSKIYSSAQVRRGVSIESTNLKARAWDFHRKLKEQIKLNPSRLPESLPNHEEHLKALKNMKKDDPLTKAKQIIGEV